MARPAAAALAASRRGEARVLALTGRLEVGGVGALWAAGLRAAAAEPSRALVIDLAGLTTCDTAGAALLLAMVEAHAGPGAASFEGADPQVAAVLERVRTALVVPPPPPPAPPLSWSQVFAQAMVTVTGGIAYLGEALLAWLSLPARWRQFRLADVVRTADEAGVRAVPLVLLLGTLIGLILAFQSLVPMRRYGADLYVANLVAIALIRELGPLLAAVVLAGRSGSAFAAEIGTMKVNQEIDALVTMGIDPMTMLVLPRMTAVLLVMPVLTVLMELAGLLGMSVVLVSAGIPLVAIMGQVSAWVVPRSFYGGLAKATVFGAVITAIGCRAGLAAGSGPRAVGEAATTAVVGGIVASIICDGVFAVLFYRLGW
jgi:phospholipid/cholesterol/gamma-HCH transport system permease protein